MTYLIDAIWLIGLALLALGLWLWSAPLSLSVIGTILFVGGVVMSWQRALVRARSKVVEQMRESEA